VAGASAAQRMGFDALGFRRPAVALWGRTIGGGLALGFLSTLAMIFVGATGMSTVIGKYSFAALVLWVWIVSSMSEEVFCRGWFQSVTGAVGAPPTFATLLPSALLFGGMHLLLIGSGVEIRTVVAVVVGTTLLGLLAAWARAKSTSLYPSIAAHVAFNVGGVIGGIAYAIAYVVVTGHRPFGMS
jgi:membrane protease YdiL (CAAX protease family)